MEKQENNTLLLTDHCFTILLERILFQFKNKHKDFFSNRVTQLYGFGNYDKSLPNLRQDIEMLTGNYTNGKYLYDKNRELTSGKPIIKLNNYYKDVLFRYIEYQDIEDFLEHEITDEREKEKQLKLLNKTNTDSTLYYVSYLFGEHKEVVKGQTIVFNDWKNIQFKYLYPEEGSTTKEFIYHGHTIRRTDTLHIKTKTLIDGKMVEGGEDVLYIGHSEPGIGAFLIGAYSGYDIYNRTIAGRIILEKYSSEEEMIKSSLDRKIPAYIAQELRNKRIINRGVVPNNSIEISKKSPYSITFDKTPGKYNLQFYQNDKELGNLQFLIDENTFKIHSLVEGILINKDEYTIRNNGTVIHFTFWLTGISLFSQLEIFFKTYYLNRNEKDIVGVFSGLDIENRLISGEVKMTFEPARH
jgi:hypothetical protein